ncbi:glycosyltransferase [Synechococcus sp. GFB01]|uniref:glycosyltransferase n=1 Tax=Synechococcus sp. GFB01 TaxID=1662190 RepID=UPI00064EAFDE|nr:glycosyltransferase [Synechococcus sp. GFB01]KMM17580.1 hypothetical protein SYNGFB01_03100 [Synechococcus sp. GFB01]
MCADGDSRDINLWSNIPFLLGAELERRGIELIRVNLQAPWLIRRLWRYSLGPRHKLRHWHTSIDFYRSRTNHWLTTRRLDRAVRRHGGPGTLLINLSISCAPSKSTIPVVLLSDWSYHHYINERLGREPDRAERGTIARETAAMARASLVVVLFPESAARLQRQIPAGRFRFLGHVINDHPLAPPPPAQPPAATLHRPWRLLFVGRPRYLEGLELLLQAVALLPADLPVQLDAIGIGAPDLASPPALQLPVHLHGYLSKADPAQRHTYYSLLNQADLVITASSGWGGFSATVEAMHRRTAVLTAPYAEFQALFGTTIPFGAYLPELTPAALAVAITTQLREPDRLAQQQQAAHTAVLEFTWEVFVDRLLAELETLTSNTWPSSIPVPAT